MRCAVYARGLYHRRLSLRDANDQRHAALRRPPLHALGNLRHHRPPTRGLFPTVVWVASTSRRAKRDGEPPARSNRPLAAR